MTGRVEAGDPAPEFRLAAGPAETIDLRALKGGKVVLYFYPKDDTPACTAEAVAFNGLRASSGFPPIASKPMPSSGANTGSN